MSADHGDGSEGPKSSRYKANNDGSFGNPPVKNQFKKGGSGGPGRKKGGKNIESALQKMFGSRVVVRQNGKQSSTTMNNAIAERVKKQLLQGPQRGLEYGLELAKKYGPPKEEPIIPDLTMLSDDEIALFKHALPKTYVSTEKPKVGRRKS